MDSRVKCWKSWGWRAWSAVAAVVVAVAVVVIVVPVVVTNNQKANRYPDYTALNYTLRETYSGASFFDNFDYFHNYDPTHGFVHYVDSEYAKTYNLTYATDDSALVKVDTTVGPSSVPNASTGRFSVRLESKKQYDRGLFIFDVKHTPYGCATWPALWLTDPNHWPDNGEMDVMEAVNGGTGGNTVTLHTTGGCSMGVKRLMSAAALQADCHNTTDRNAGCGARAGSWSYGPAFNAAGGGVVALEWRDAGIRVWQFARGNIPVDIVEAASPRPAGWGTALADFPATHCDVATHFRNQSIIVNIALCGDMIYDTWNTTGCSPDTCQDYVANNPSAFTTAYWEFGGFSIYDAIPPPS